MAVWPLLKVVLNKLIKGLIGVNPKSYANYRSFLYICFLIPLLSPYSDLFIWFIEKNVVSVVL